MFDTVGEAGADGGFLAGFEPTISGLRKSRALPNEQHQQVCGCIAPLAVRSQLSFKEKNNAKSMIQRAMRMPACIVLRRTSMWIVLKHSFRTNHFVFLRRLFVYGVVAEYLFL